MPGQQCIAALAQLGAVVALTGGDDGVQIGGQPQRMEWHLGMAATPMPLLQQHGEHPVLAASLVQNAPAQHLPIA